MRRRSFWSPRNDLPNAWAMTVLRFGGLTAGFRLTVLPFLAAQAVVGFSLLEAVNYLEHYGLPRRRNAAGRHEKVDPRRSDHHGDPSRATRCARWTPPPSCPPGTPE